VDPHEILEAALLRLELDLADPSDHLPDHTLCGRFFGLERPEHFAEILDVLARVITNPPPPFDVVLLDELEGASLARGDCEYLLITPPLFGEAPKLLAQLAERRPVHTVLVGGPAVAPGWPVDARVPGDFDWRGNGALALA